LQAIIGGTSAPLRNELQLLQREAARTGPAISAGIEGGGHGGVKAGAIRETLVLMREISRGNWTRVPGSFTLLLDRLGLLNKLFGNTAAAANVLTQALGNQAKAAGIAAVEAERMVNSAKDAAKALITKAEASKAAAIADSILKDQTYAAATAVGLEGQGFQVATNAAREKAAASRAAFLADLEAADAAVVYAQACTAEAEAAALAAKEIRAKAVASAEAAGAEGAAAGASLGMIGVALAAVVVAGLAVYETFWGMRKALEGFKLPDSTFDYVAKGARSADQLVNAQRKVTDEVRETVEAYHNAEAAARRVSEATEEHFRHQEKMNSLIKDPALRAAAELSTQREKQNMELGNKVAEKQNLEVESRNKLAAAGKLFKTVMSEDEEKAHAKILRERAEAAEKFLKDEDANKGHAGKAAAVLFGGAPWKMGDRLGAVNASITRGQAEAQAAVDAEKAFKDQEAERKRIRDEAKKLVNQAGADSARAASIGEAIPDLQKKNAQAIKDREEESRAEIANAPNKMVHGHVSELQKVGAYTTGAVDIAHRQLSVLHKIEKNTGHLGNNLGSAGGHGGQGGTVF
jgi:hypothetical protein